MQQVRGTCAGERPSFLVCTCVHTVLALYSACADRYSWPALNDHHVDNTNENAFGAKICSLCQASPRRSEECPSPLAQAKSGGDYDVA